VSGTGQNQLQAAAVEGRGFERRNVDIVETAHIDRNHFIALRIPAARESAHAAVRTKQVMDGFLAKLVVLERVRAGAQREACRRHEGPERAALLADRAIAGRHVAEVGRHLETHLSAMAAAGIGHGPGHYSKPSRLKSLANFA